MCDPSPISPYLKDALESPYPPKERIARNLRLMRSLSEYSSLMRAPMFERTRLVELARSGDLKHRSKCPLVGCKGLLKKAVAFVTKENHDPS